MTRPTVLFPPEHDGRTARRSTVGRRVAWLWQVLLLALAAAGLAGFFWPALA